MSHRAFILATRLMLSVSCVSAMAQTADSPGPGFQPLGKIKPRAATEIASSSWSVGGETLDRDFAVYANYKTHLGPLGAKAIRLQAGWAKCEKQRGDFDWAWLDAIVNDARAQGVQPWLQLSYGNPIYPGGGDTGLGGGFPTTTEALAAWDRWVRATVEHFKGRIHEWEIWNEPDLNETGSAPVSAYVDLFVRTSAIIREIQPKGQSRIDALALCYNLEYADKFIKSMADRKKLDLIDAVTIHTYPNNPDDTRNIDQLRAMIARTGRAIPVRQGETGATSKFQENFALKKMPWSETMQAKWNLRRMLAHHGKDVPFNLFTMIDQHYQRDGETQMNYKGLLASREDQTVAYAKPAYFAAQNVFTIFDDSLVRLTNFSCTANVTNSLAAFAYANRTNGAQVVTLWFKHAMPADSNVKTQVDLNFSGARFIEPVYADLLTGQVHALPNPVSGARFRQIPLYDSPIVIAERTALLLETTTSR